jgi:hypothetical protein
MSAVIACMLLVFFGADPVNLSLQATTPLASDSTNHVQGLAVDGKRFFLSSVDKGEKTGWVYVIDRDTYKIQKSIRLALGDQYHPGGMQLVGDFLYVPLAEYRPKSSATILKVDTRNYQVHFVARVDDHVGAIAVAKDGTMYLANWDAREIIILEPDGKVREKKLNPTSTAYQDMEWHEGKLWGTGHTSVNNRPTSVIDVIDIDGWEVAQRFTLSGKTTSGNAHFGREGFTKEGNILWFVPEDGPKSTLYKFQLP